MQLVSIIMPLFNKGKYVRETIQSILKQTYNKWELLVVNNNSIDEGPDLVQQLSEEDNRIRLISCVKQGPGASRNYGLTRAAGEWVLFLDADDLLTPEYLTSRMRVADANRDCDLMVGHWEEFSDRRTNAILRRATAFGESIKELKNSAIAFAPWALHAAMIRRSLLLRGLKWPEELDNMPSEDTAFWFPVICNSSIAWINEAGALYRVQTETSRNEIQLADRWVQAVIAVIDYNVNYYLNQGYRLNTEQYINIVRVHESNYRMAISKRSRTAAALALKQAQNWLSKCPADSFSIGIRKLLGLRIFNLLRFGVI